MKQFKLVWVKVNKNNFVETIQRRTWIDLIIKIKQTEKVILLAKC